MGDGAGFSMRGSDSDSTRFTGGTTVGGRLVVGEVGRGGVDCCAFNDAGCRDICRLKGGGCCDLNDGSTSWLGCRDINVST